MFIPYRAEDDTHPDILMKHGELTSQDLRDKFPWVLKMSLKGVKLSLVRGKLAFIEGSMLSGIWEGGVIYKAVVDGAEIRNSTWIFGIVKSGKVINTRWMGGTFAGGLMYDCSWEKGTQQGGVLENVRISEGLFSGGELKKCTLEKGYVEGSVLRNCSMKSGVIELSKVFDSNVRVDELISTTISGGEYRCESSDSFWEKSEGTGIVFHDGWMQSGSIRNSNIYDGIFDDGYFSGCYFSGGELHGGTFTKCTFDGADWYYGVYVSDNIWKKGTWKKGRLNEKHGEIVYSPPATKDELVSTDTEACPECGKPYLRATGWCGNCQKRVAEPKPDCKSDETTTNDVPFTPARVIYQGSELSLICLDCAKEWKGKSDEKCPSCGSDAVSVNM